MAEQTVVGLALVKINGTFHLDVKGARWSVRRADMMHVTGAGNKQAIGLPQPSGSFDEVIPRAGVLDWASLKDFSIELLDYEGKTTLFAADVCNWTNIDGSTDLGGASTTKSVNWTGSTPVKW
jgi:hypothetical protein